MAENWERQPEFDRRVPNADIVKLTVEMTQLSKEVSSLSVKFDTAISDFSKEKSNALQMDMLIKELRKDTDQNTAAIERLSNKVGDLGSKIVQASAYISGSIAIVAIVYALFSSGFIKFSGGG